MKKQEFVPRFTKDKRLDPASFSDAGDHAVEAWLKQRLSGHDPFLPLDKRLDEDPEALLVGIVRSCGCQHPGVQVIGRVVGNLLKKTPQSAQKMPGYWGPLLRLCEQVTLPYVSDYFSAELGHFSNEPGKIEKHLGGEAMGRRFAFAALRQAPSFDPENSSSPWLALLKQPAYCTIALMGLGPSFAARVKHLPTWWGACPVQKRERELVYLLRNALSTAEDEVSVLNILRSGGNSFSMDLKHALNRSLKANNATEAFSSPSCVTTPRYNAIHNAGHRYEGAFSGAGA